MIGKSISKPRSPVPNSESVPKSKPTRLPTSDAVISLSVFSISISDLSAAATSNISTTATNNLSIPTDPNTTPKLTTQWNSKTENDSIELEIGDSSLSIDPQFFTATIWIMPAEFGYWSIPELEFPELFKFPGHPRRRFNHNIPPATITKDKSLATIFPFEFEETAAMPLFSGATLEAKPITVMYTDTKVEGQFIKLILDSAASARIITANGVTKTLISEIDDFPFKVNDIMTLIKVLVMEATQYQALELQLTYQGQHICVPATCGHFKTPPREKLLIELEEEKEKPIGEAYQGKGKQKEKLTWETDDLTWTDNDKSKLTSSWKWEEDKKNKRKGKEEKTTQTTTIYNTYTIPQQSTYRRPKLICDDCGKKLSSIGTCCEDNEEYSMATRFYCHLCILEHFGRPKQDNQPCLACGETLLDEKMWHDIPGWGGTYNVECQYTILISDWVKKRTPIEATWQRAVQQLDSCPHDDDKIWRMATAKIEGALPEEIRTIKNNPPEPIELDWDAEPVINFLEPEEFYEHYQNLAPTREEQKQWLAQLNTKLCHHCLIPSDFEYCDDCDLIYNPPPRMIYSIPEEEEPISSCALETELLINHDPDSNDDDKNNSSSSIQNGNNNENNSDSDSKPDLNYKQYITLPDLSKEQELKWYSDNGEGIMPKCAHDTDARFDLRYPRKDVIKLEPHSHTCIDLKIALEIPATTMIQLASRSSLAKRGINIKEEIINAEYVGNIIAMLQNDSEKTYIIEPNEKIGQAIFLPLIRVAQLVSVEKREKLGLIARGIQGFGSMGRTNILVNMTEKKIIGQGEIISTGQAISIPPYSQYMLTIERKEKEQEQIFEAETTLCESGEIGLINLHIPAKNYSSIKILIYNNTGNVISIPEGTTIGYLTTEIENQPPNPISDFPQFCGYVDITSQTIYG
ncbi:hypothetical protein G9A89_023670 [Geosiphon pyriformis]|nr:hypothetical protein G9A89_023670 [Geosiphon pyriformis]